MLYETIRMDLVPIFVRLIRVSDGVIYSEN